MKVKIEFFLAVLCIIIISCNKDQKLISEIAGEYKIESIINYNNGQPTTVSFTTGTIVFHDCTMKDGVGGNCTGSYQIDGRPKVNFQYYTRKEKNSKTIKINNPSSFEEPAIMGYYEFKQEGGAMFLNGIEGSDDATNGVSYSDYSNIKLSKK